MAKLAIVFDYDWSLINTNSDTFVFERLAPDVLVQVKEESKRRRGEWTKIIDEGLVSLQEKHGVKIEAILQCLAKVPIQEGMLESIHDAHAANVPVFIVSDASQSFIKAFVDEHKLEEMFHL